MTLSPRPDTARQIVHHLTRIAHQHFFKSFDDWLSLAINAFLRDDDAYMAIMKTYGPRDPRKDHPADHFARALGIWMNGMQQRPADYLGQVYEEQSIVNAYQGQFFTPEPIVELMAAITMPDELADEALVSDPACGSGRMLVAGIKRNRFATFLGVDTDLTCIHMAALNCLVRNANTYLVHGNSLSLEAHGGYFVRRTPFGGELHRLSQPDAERLIRLPFETAKTAEATTALSPVEPPLTPTPRIEPLTADQQAALDNVTGQFTTDKKGQRGFGF